MKILIVRTHASILSSTSYNVQEIGLAKAYVKAGHECDIVMYGGREADHIVEMPADGSTIRLMYRKAYSFMKSGLFPGIRKLASEYDLIQVHEYDQITSWLLYTDKKLKDKVIIYHGPYYSDFNKGYNLRCKLFDSTFKLIRRNPDCPCFTKSEAAADFLRSKGFTNVKAVGVGLDSSVWDEDVRLNKLSEDEVGDLSSTESSEQFTYVYIGKLEPRRNTLFLLDVVDRLLTEHDDVRFVLVGDGKEDYKSQCLTKAAKWIDNGRIVYKSRVEQKDMPAVYAEADCMLFPSIYEIFGMVLMEAMYFCVPIISSDNGGADVLLRNEENGLVIESNSNSSKGFDVDQWVQTAELMYSDENLRNRIKNQLMIDKDKLGWADVAEKILSNI